VDVSSILEDARTYSAQRTQERLNDALDRAREAAERQEALLKYATGFNPRALQKELPLTPDHLTAFVEGMFKMLGIEIRERTHADRIWALRLPEKVQRETGLKPGIRVTFHRALSRRFADLHLIDGASVLLKFLFRTANEPGFNGNVASSAGLPVTVCAELAWNDTVGRRLHQRFAVVQAEALNPTSFADFLLTPAQDAVPDATQGHFADLLPALHRRLAAESSDAVQPGDMRISGLSLPEQGQTRPGQEHDMTAVSEC